MLCGVEGIISLPSTILSEVASTEEFINQIKLYKEGIRRFNDRNPKLEWSAKKETFATLGLVIHDLVNARKFINHSLINLDEINQMFYLDFTTETITLYGMNTHEELGQMHLNIIFDNWKETFYSHLDSWVVDMEFVEEGVEKVVESTQYELMLPKMIESLDSDAFELWNNLFTLLKCDGTTISEKDTICIHYSGGGDSGDIDSINIEELEKDAVSLDEIFDSETVNNIRSLIWKIIDSKERGFENNDGGYGEMTIRISKFKWNHSNYYQHEDQTVAEEYDFDDLEEEVILETKLED